MSAALDAQAVTHAFGEATAEADRHRSLGVAQHGQVADGQFGAEITYSPEVHRAATVQALAERFLAALRRLLAQCAGAEQGAVPAYTPADFPLMDLSQRELDELLGDAAGVLQDR